ncbi:MAG: hypothetical protein IPN29_03810 [Saprospiraceae bacterium]|nr:hypothetical protein [Saprospiraceae bacterium]
MFFNYIKGLTTTAARINSKDNNHMKGKTVNKINTHNSLYNVDKKKG